YDPHVDAPPPRTRIASLDVVRGVVMLLMAIDHVRVYAGVPAGGPPPSVFFTRWITHFVAPAFVFLAGTSASLHVTRLPTGGVLGAAAASGLWKSLCLGGAVHPFGDGGPPLLVLFVLVPWIGVMCCGYAFGAVMERPAEERRRIMLRLGLALTVAFVVLRTL